MQYLKVDTMSAGEKEEDNINKYDRRGSKDQEKNLISPMSLKPLHKETTISEQSKDYFKLSFFKGYAIRIYKPLFLIKVALFFWFAGGIATQTFFPVFLKQRGDCSFHFFIPSSVGYRGGVFTYPGTRRIACYSDCLYRSFSLSCRQRDSEFTWWNTNKCIWRKNCI
ncbi:hypothetical protein JTE90_023418 [Oedothorax gibbosus]|uniref:Uncharacterized protein n=1 Tax=Oedothorax gibbosus TaxID=931172 RepID=A0AAV6TRK7_9ARAC|nr:hypothetical protein JTE90_023418 [Oedothorax gibbosus]